METETAFVALVAAASAVFGVGGCVDALSFAASLRVATLLSTPPTVEPIRHHIYTLLLAAVLPCTSLLTAYGWVLVACHLDPDPSIAQNPPAPS